MTSVFSWQNSVRLCHFILYSKTKLACYSRYLLTTYFYFCLPIPYDEKNIFFFGVSSRRSCSSSYSQSTLTSLALLVWAQTWITVILNGLPWRRTEIILSFLRLHPSTAFQTLLLTMMATPVLLRDSYLMPEARGGDPEEPSTSKARASSWEEHPEERWLRRRRRAQRSYPTLKSGTVVIRGYPSSKVRSSGCALLEQP